MLQASSSANTKAVYQNALKCFSDFRSKYSLAHSWPVPVAHAANFISYCFNQGYSPATVSTYMSSISYIHKLRALDDPTESFLIKKILEGFRRLKSSKDMRAPITRELLIRLIDSLPAVCYSEYESSLFKSLFTLAYFGLFRIGELVYTDHRQAGYALQLADITLSDQKLTICVRLCKTNKTGKPIFVHISSVSDKRICPVIAMQQFMHLRSTGSGSLFIHANMLPVTRYQFCAILNKAVSSAGLSNQCVRSHSFRIGRATELAMAGVPSDQIKLMGRWQSDCYTKYIRP